MSGNGIDIHALSGAYAVDALDADERARFETHLAECPACRDEVRELTETAAVLTDATAVAPPPALRERILGDIATIRPLPPVTSIGTEAPTRRRRRFPVLAAAAAVVAVVGIGITATQPWQDETSQMTTAADRILSSDDAREVALEFDGGATATLTHSSSVGGAVLRTTDMPLAPEGSVYELWLQVDDEMVPAGLMPPAADQVFVLEGDASEATAAAISVEPEGGSEQPTTDPIAFFDLSDET